MGVHACTAIGDAVTRVVARVLANVERNLTFTPITLAEFAPAPRRRRPRSSTITRSGDTEKHTAPGTQPAKSQRGAASQRVADLSSPPPPPPTWNARSFDPPRAAELPARDLGAQFRMR